MPAMVRPIVSPLLGPSGMVTRDWIQGSSSMSFAYGRSLKSRAKHCWRKLVKAFENPRSRPWGSLPPSRSSTSSGVSWELRTCSKRAHGERRSRSFHGGRPVIIFKTNPPKDQTSDLRPTLPSLIVSGAMKGTLMISADTPSAVLPSRNFAFPKSANFATPSDVT